MGGRGYWGRVEPSPPPSHWTLLPCLPKIGTIICPSTTSFATPLSYLLPWPFKEVKIYRVEPVTDLHEQLRASIKKAKLDNVYTVVPCGIENTTELQKYGIEPESMDTIISISVLCSVPQPEEVANRLYSLLKPGGKLIFYEHVRSPDIFSSQVQCKPICAFDQSKKLERLIPKV